MPTACEFVDIVAKFLAIGGAWIAVCTYRKNSKLERAKWLNGLYERFYEKETFKQIRLAIDYNSTSQYSELKEALDKDSFPELQEKLVDYLNFFEFIATLTRTKQLKVTDVNMVFGYYINILKDSEHIIKFIKRSGFQNLEVLISQINKLRNN